jgi:hypothetical protein
MKERKPISIERAPLVNSVSRENVVAVYPNAGCLKFVFNDSEVHYQIYCEEEPHQVWIGYSTKSQTKAWENAWNVITRKMMKKLEW